MNFGFSQSAMFSIADTASEDLMDRLPVVIGQYAGLEYSCFSTTHGYYLKPSFRNMPYKNSFVPEIRITLSPDPGQVLLHLEGRPVKLVRNFLWFWFGFLLVMEALLVLVMSLSGLGNFFFTLLPALMCIFGYFLCKIVSNRTFHQVVNALQKGLSCVT